MVDDGPCHGKLRAGTDTADPLAADSAGMTTSLAPKRATMTSLTTTLFMLLVAAQVGVIIFSWWEPPFDGTIRYDDVAPLRDLYWPMNALLGGPSYALSAICVSISLAVLGAGRAWSLIGAVLHLLGGIVFALVITAETLPFAWALDPAVADERLGRSLFDAYNANLDAFLPYILAPMGLGAIGALIGVVAAARVGAVPWWTLAATGAVAVAVFLVPIGGPASVIVDLAQRALLIWIGWRALRAAVPRA